MTEFLSELKENEEVQKICKEHSLNISMLRELFMTSARGYNNTEVAEKLGIHRVTVQRYNESLKKMKRKDYIRIFNFVMKDHLEKQKVAIEESIKIEK